ncbi:unnamed protein product [Urochloa decumbens]|uniref:Uncharacterized protein n=1 Tax=Urochloa decumbens TaxID=240449 RepID=A0ABC8ZEN1_9POAL
MARAVAAAVLALAVCCLLVAPAPARRPADLPSRAALDAIVVDREAAAEPLLPKPAAGADCGEAADEQRTALAVPEEEEEPRQRTSLLCLVFRCGGEPAHAGGALGPRRSSSDEPAAMDDWVRPAVPGKAEAEAENDEAGEVDERPYETDSDSDWESDSDDEDEGGILGWLWSLLAHRF